MDWRSRKQLIERYKTGDLSEGFTIDETTAHRRGMRAGMRPGGVRRATQRRLNHLPSQRYDFIKIMRQY